MATDVNDPRYWRGKLMTARRMERADDVRIALRQLGLLKTLRSLELTYSTLLTVDPDNAALGHMRVAMNALETSRDAS